MKKRLFLGLPLPNWLQHEISTYSDSWKKLKVRSVPPQKWHVTVAFLGDVDERWIPAINEKLTIVSSKFKPFALQFDRFTFGPPGSNPSMVWGRFKTHPSLSQISQTVYKSLHFLVDKDTVAQLNRPLVPHVTLARFKTKPPDLELPSTVTIKTAWEVEECVLYESRLTPAGAKYRRVGKYQFVG